MVRKIFVHLLVLSATLLFADSDYCSGWEDGYKAGYCYRQYGCIAPIAPLCPLPRLGESSYNDGYQRGFLRGLNDRE